MKEVTEKVNCNLLDFNNQMILECDKMREMKSGLYMKVTKQSSA